MDLGERYQHSRPLTSRVIRVITSRAPSQSVSCRQPINTTQCND